MEEQTNTIDVHAYDWVVRDEYGDDDNVVIHCWGLDINSKATLIRFNNFPAYCYIELPETKTNNNIINWKTYVEDFIEILRFILKDDAPIKYKLLFLKKTYYYEMEKKYPMLQICFKNLKSMRHCSNLLSKPLKVNNLGQLKYNVWEDTITIVRKLLTIREIKYSQWFRVRATKVEKENKISSIEREYMGEWDTMNPISLEECKNWNTFPGIVAFDIECYSSNHRAMPDKYDAMHVAYMISCIFQKYKDQKTRKRYGIIIGECDNIPEERLKNCEIIKVKGEIELIEAFAKIINETDPDVITGYNILSFDYPYLDHRIKRWLREWPCMGRILGEPSKMSTKTWHSGAYGYQSINILHMEGRISIDLLPIVKRDYKMTKYDLNTVSKKFIGKTKHDINAVDMFVFYENMINATNFIKNCISECNLNEDYEYNDDISKLNEILKLENIDKELVNKLENGISMYEKAKNDITKVMEYCIQDSELVIELMEKLNIWIGLIEMSNIVGVTIVELFTAGQQGRCISQLYDLASRMGHVLDKRDTPGFKFSGGYVCEPIPGLYENIICLDFASLYPSIMQGYNICYTTLVPSYLENLVPDDDCNIIEFDQDEIDNDNDIDNDDEDEFLEIKENINKKKEIITNKHYRFKFFKNKEGLLPRLVRQLVSERRAVNRLIVEIKEEIKALELTDDLFVSLQNNKIIDITSATKKLNNLVNDNPNPNKHLLNFYNSEFQIAQYQIDNNIDDIKLWMSSYHNNRNHNLSKIDENKLLIIVLDKRQLALKVSANSFFGFLGVHTDGKMPLIEAAMSITAKGRELVGAARKYIEDTYNGVQIYSDTDSVMMSLPTIKDSKECNYWGIRLSQEISGIKPGQKDCDGVFWPDGRKGLFPPPLTMEFEKAMRLLCLKKKKYAALLIGKDGKFKREDITDKSGNVTGSRYVMLTKGIVLARRDNCITGDSLVTLSNGTSVAIKNLTQGNAKLYGWNGIGTTTSNQTAFIPQGRKQTLKINIIDGRTITCTPEHRLLIKRSDGSIVWKEARNINISTDKVICGLEAPEDIIGNDEINWQLDIEGYHFDMSPQNRSRTLAFMRILGYINSDGRIDCSVHLGHMIDVNAMLDDIELVCGIRPIVTERTTKLSSFYQIRIPNAISEIFVRIQGQDIGRRSEQSSSWPTFLSEANCPKAILREFCGGLFGGDGISPYLSKQGAKCDSHKIDQTILIELSTRLENQNSLKLKMEILCDILARAGYQGCELSDSVETYSVNNSSTNDTDLRVMYRIKSPSTNKCGFLRTIGYRYCIHKQTRHTAAQSLWRLEETIMPNTVGWLNDIGALSWFDKEGYAVDRNTMNIPVLYLPVHSIIDGGEQEVYDISVDRLESFIANGIIVHNCTFLRTTYYNILDMIMDKRPLDAAMNLLIDSIQNLWDGKISFEDLLIIRELGSNYKSDSFFMKVFSDYLKKCGKIVNPGDRLDFIIISDPSVSLLGKKMRLSEQYVDSLKSSSPLLIDYEYYIDKILMKPINQLISVGYKNVIDHLHFFSYRPSNRHKAIHLDKPLKIILHLYKRGYDLNIFKQAILHNVSKFYNSSPPSPPPPPKLLLNIISSNSPRVNSDKLYTPKSSISVPNFVKINNTQPKIVLNILSPNISNSLIVPNFASHK